VSFRLAPSVSPDTQFFWDGLKDHQLLIQRCASCGVFRHPPRPMCPSCNSLEWDTVTASGRGTVHSFVMPQHPPMPFMEHPYIVALVDLEEGTRLLSNLCEVAPGDASIGMPVEVFYTEFDEGLVLHQFRPTGAR
jgi:uncharacterized OB-fold protein